MTPNMVRVVYSVSWQLFVMINSKAVGGARSARNQLSLNAENLGRRGMAAAEAGANVDKHSLSRHEYLNCVTRMAIMRYILTKKEHDVASRPRRPCCFDYCNGYDCCDSTIPPDFKLALTNSLARHSHRSRQQSSGYCCKILCQTLTLGYQRIIVGFGI